MKIVVVCVGRPRDGRLAVLHDDWAERIRRLGVDYRAKFVPETKAGGRYSDDHVRAREAAAIEAALPPRGRVVALDSGGESLTSEDLARRLSRWARPLVAFAIGGPLGLDREFVGRVDASLSLSRLTFPHEVARALLAEQLYRATTILRGVPYHKGSAAGSAGLG